MSRHDAIIIGTGQAGPALARRLVAADWNVAIIERKLFGGTCVNTGCTPTKTLVAAELEKRIREALHRPGRTEGVRKIAARFAVSPDTVQRISRPFEPASASVAA
jgi:pyruvate/2-oxoglutarate dehydrogenase complex dihydrolipoamide dehydrogenase (E3) component